MKFWYNPNFIAIFFLIFFSLFALKSLAKGGFYTSHDGETHTARIAQYYQALKDGQYPPRWAKTLSSGLGSPIFVYIYPLPYLLGSLVHALGASFVNSFKILMATSFVLSAIFAYLWLVEIFESEKAAFLGAIAYSWVPYRFSLIYVRASLSEALAYTFLPLLLWSLAKLAKNTYLKWMATSSVALAFLMLSQNLVAYMAIPVVAIYVFLLGFWQKSPKFFLYSIAAAVWGFGIAAVTYLPDLFERNYVHFDELFQNVYNSHFVTFAQLIHSPWDYGFDLPGTINDRLSFQIGLAHILIILISALILLLAILKKVSFIKETRIQKILAVFFLVVLIISIFLMLETRVTHLVWKTFKPLQVIDIPWRLLGIAALASAYLASFVAKSVKSGLVFILLAAALLIANRNHLRINETKLYDDQFFLDYAGSATQLNEFTPKSRSSIGITDQFRERIEVVRGDVKITGVTQKSNLLSFTAESGQVSRLLVNIVSFPGWQILMDGKNFQSVDDPVLFRQLYRPDRDNTGLFYLIIPGGTHHFTFKFTETKTRTLADLVSLVAIATAMIVLAASFSLNRKS